MPGFWTGNPWWKQGWVQASTWVAELGRGPLGVPEVSAGATTWEIELVGDPPGVTGEL